MRELSFRFVKSRDPSGITGNEVTSVSGALLCGAQFEEFPSVIIVTDNAKSPSAFCLCKDCGEGS